MKKSVVKRATQPVVSKNNISAKINEEARRNRMAPAKKIVPRKIHRVIQNRINSNNVPIKTNNKPIKKQTNRIVPVKKPLMKVAKNIPAKKIIKKIVPAKKVAPIKKVPRHKSRINFKVLAISFLVVLINASLGLFFTSSTVNSPWYGDIKPLYTPPNFVFPIVWGVLFTLIALSLYLSWTNADKRERHEIVFVFTVNILLNIIWSFLFFFLQNPIFAFFEIIPLLFSVLLMIFATFRINKTACYFLVPYFLWVAFAAALNYLSAFT